MDNLNVVNSAAIARVFSDLGPVAFVAVLHDHESPDGETRAALGVAVANDRGFRPIPQLYFTADTLDVAQDKADALNRDALGLDDETATAIQISTMGGRPYFAPAETLNGFPVIAAQRLPDRPGNRPARAVLVDRGEGAAHRYVTALHCDGDSSWLWGGYHDTESDARADLASRVAVAGGAA